MSSLPNPPRDEIFPLRRRELIELAATLAPCHGYNQTRLGAVRVLRTETLLHDIPVLYKPGAVFVIQGSKQGILDGEVFRYDEDHYLAVSLPVPFRMESTASPDRPLFAVYVEFDMQMAGEIAFEVEKQNRGTTAKAMALVSSRMDADIEDVLVRLLKTLRSPADVAILGASILRELHYRVLIGPQGCAMIAALQQKGMSGKIIRSLNWLRENFGSEISISQLAKEVGMSAASYHAHFKTLIGTSPMQYVKALRLHEARLMVVRQSRTIAEVAALVGYASPAQFSRDFKRHFGRTASDETKWVRLHLGEQSAVDVNR